MSKILSPFFMDIVPTNFLRALSFHKNGVLYTWKKIKKNIPVYNFFHARRRGVFAHVSWRGVRSQIVGLYLWIFPPAASYTFFRDIKCLFRTGCLSTISMTTGHTSGVRKTRPRYCIKYSSASVANISISSLSCENPVPTFWNVAITIRASLSNWVSPSRIMVTVCFSDLNNSAIVSIEWAVRKVINP